MSEIGETSRDGTQSADRLALGDGEYRALVRVARVVRGDRTPGIHDDGRVRAADQARAQGGESRREARDQGGGVAHPRLHRAVGLEGRGADLGRHRTQREVVGLIAIGREGVVSRERELLGGMEQLGFLGL